MDFSPLRQIRYEDLSLTQPSWLWLLALIPLLFVIQWLFSLVDLSRFQQTISAFIRALILLCLALALAGLAARSFSQDLALVVAVDVSPSVPDASLQKAQEYIHELWKGRRKNDSLKLLTFASSTRLLDPPSDKPPVLKRHAHEKASDLQAAIRHAYGLFPSGTIRRLLLISDGRETQGHALDEIHRAKAQGIRVFTQAIRGPYPPEVLLQDLRLSHNPRLRAPFELIVDVFSTYAATQVPLTIYKDGFVHSYRKVDLQPGLQAIRFKAQIDQPGITSFQAIIKPEKDRWRGNNFAVRAIPIQGEPRILYLEGNPAQASYLTRALQKQKFDVDVRSSYGVPSSLRDLERYDLVILSDIPAYQISSSQMRLLEMYVRDLGGGLVMTGGENSFGPGGYFQTRIEQILPVRFDIEKKQETPSLALALVVDRSGSMSGARMALAREAAKATVQILGPNDLIGVVAFDSRPREVVAMQSATNKSRILYDISRISAAGGTEFTPALEMAYRMLSSVRAKIKHVILLSDGEAPQTGLFEIIQAMSGEQITLSTVGIGTGTATALLQKMAEAGNGRYYFTEDPYNIPKIFTKETSKVSRSSFVEEPFRPRVTHYTQAVKGIDFASGPYLLGYVSTKAKPTSHVILSTEYGEPLLATWRIGLGRVGAFTSDVKNRWSAQWLSWAGYGQFWSQVAREHMRQGPSKDFHMKAFIREGQGHIHVDAIGPTGEFLDFLKAKATILDPRLEKTDVTLRQTGPGFYQGTFPAKRHGAYLIQGRFFEKNRLLGIGQASASYSYPAEYLTASPDIPSLEALASIGQGKLDPSVSELQKLQKDEKILTHRPLWPYLLFLALCLFLLDIFLRRVRIFGRATFLSKRAKPASFSPVASLLFLGLASASLPAFAGPPPGHYGYGRYGRPAHILESNREKNLPSGRVRLQSLKIQGKVDKDKLKLSLEYKLPALALCVRYLYALQQGLLLQEKPFSRTLMERINAIRERLRKAENKGPLPEGGIALSITLNAHGRATHTKFLSSPLPLPYQDCFVGSLSGRKFFAPQDKKTASFTATFLVEAKAEEVKKPPESAKPPKKRE